jgi:VCBS repeat protein
MYKANGPLLANAASLLLVVVLLGSPLLAQSISFTRTDYSVGSFPSSIATGDLNGDGYLDLVVANGGDSTVSVLFGNPDGTFQPAIQFAAGNGPVSVVIADFNGDGNLDIATANAGVSEPTRSVSVLLGDGKGNFGSPINSPTGTYPMAMAVGDVNNDGIPDLVLAQETVITVLLGNGDGTFRAPVHYTTGGAKLRSITLGDFNNDGNLDIAAGDYFYNNVEVLLGDGLGNFGTAATYSVDGHPSGVAVGDFNNDGNLDLVSANRFLSDVTLLLGDGNGGFRSSGNFLAGQYCRALGVGDFDGDGNLDLAVANAEFDDNTVSVLLGDGNGGFSPAVNFPTGIAPTSIAVGDFNGDGYPDLAVANHDSNSVTVLINNRSQ